MTCIDTHVHLHRGVPLEVLLARALSNLKRNGDERAAYMLMLAQCGTDLSWAELQKAFDAGVPGLSVLRTQEAGSVCVVFPAGERLYLAAGQQVVTSEKLEVLSLASAAGIAAGMTLTDTLEAIDQAGGVPVVPWGAGKWTGVRLTVLQKALDGRRTFFRLGDNGGRPACWRLPVFPGPARDFLNGSDPLPVSGDKMRAGTYGIRLDGAPDPAAPARWVADRLKDPALHPERFGKNLALLSFLRNQLLLRL
jgi:hypothetical protein